jgi:peptide/nickel transport system substrate-binding protein
VHVRRASLAAAMAAALTLVAAACGSDDATSTSSSAPGTTAGQGRFSGATPGQGSKGGKLTVINAADVDYVDPGQVYYAFGYMIHYAVNRGLYAYGPGDNEKPRADLATGDPQISADQKTITVHLKPGVKFAPPVDREVTSKDVKYGFERAFSRNVPSSYATVYFKDIVGAPKKPGAIRDIAGITTPDDRTIVFKLSTPSGALVSQALAMPISTPVPREYAAKFDAHNPSTYDQYVAFTGPYMYKNDASGKLVGRKPGRLIELVRNPNWDAKTDFRPALLDAITVQEGNDDFVSAARRVLGGSAMVQGDGTTPAPVLKQVTQSRPEQVALIPSGGYRMIAMNTSIKPFDNLNLRKAVLAASDRNALRLTRGGALLGDVATHFLPTGFPGFEEAGGKAGPDLDFLRSPTGDPELAAQYMKKAGYPSGKYTGGQKFLMVASNADPGKKTAEVAQGQFEKLGFKINFRLVPQDTLYTRFCNVPKAAVVICPNVGFFKDFNDPQSLLDPVFNGDNILPANNSNWSQLNVPAINAAMTKAAVLPRGAERLKAWGEIDKLVTAQAPAIPFIWDKVPTVESKDVRGVVNEYATSWDLSFTSLK